MRAKLPDALGRLRDDLKAVRLDLAVPGAEEARRTRVDLVAQVDDYLLPRLGQMDAPALIVVGGSTGAGKSTLLNSLVESIVSPAGVLRPTTRAPVLAFHPDDLEWFEGARVLPGLPRASGGEARPGTVQLAPTESLPQGLALLDSPDIDSVLAENRALAGQLLAAADGWLFVTTAARYADAVPWEFLRAARDRGTALSLVLNRVPEDADREVAAHLEQMLEGEGLPEADVLVVPETPLAEGLLPAPALAPVRAWLDDLAADAQARDALVRRTLRGALASLPARAAVVESAAVEQISAAAELRAEADAAYAAAGREVEVALRSGSLLRGEVLARWHEVIGTGDVMRALESRVGWARDRVKSVLTGRPAADEELRGCGREPDRGSNTGRCGAGVGTRIAGLAGTWAGSRAASDSTTFDRASRELEACTQDEVRAWQGFVFERVSREGESKRTTARLTSLGVNGAGLTVMLAVFVHTGGLTGAEVVVAGGTSALSQKVLEAIFGDQAVRTLASRAREDLIERVDRLLRGEAARFHALLDEAVP